MKKILTLLCALLPLLAMAQRISDDEAAEIASQVLGKHVVKAEVKKQAKAPGMSPSHCDVELDAPFYSIFTGEDGDGFVIVSKDRRAPKIIGYGDGKVDANNLPPQLKYILEKQDSVLQVAPNLPEHSSWKSKAPKAPTRAGEDGGKVLKTATWGQDEPYNRYTPIMEEVHAPTGSVATAMAIIMNYHKWPERGQGSNEYKIWMTCEPYDEWNLSYDFSKKIDWENIKDDYSDGYTEEEAEAVADLMYRCGVGLEIDYTPYSSYGASLEIAENLEKYNFYSNYTVAAFAKRNPVGLWDEVLRNEIDEGRPVVISGMWHCFVGDGYDSESNVHINWGWDGGGNGFFSWDFLSKDGWFPEDLEMITGIQPIRDGEIYSPVQMTHYRNGFGFQLDRENIVVGEPFSAFSSSLQSREDFNGEIGVVLTDAAGNVKAVASSFETIKDWDPHFPKGYFYDLFQKFDNCLIEGTTIEPGDKIKLMAKAKGEEWLQVRGSALYPTEANAIGNKVKKANIIYDIQPESLEVRGFVKKAKAGQRNDFYRD